MRKLFLVFILLQFPLVQNGQIIADHTVVDKFDDIPTYYINEVKKMLFIPIGESHSQAYVGGLERLEALDPTYDVYKGSYPNSIPYATTYLRTCRSMWGDIDQTTGWVAECGEEDWWATPAAIAQIKTGISYCNSIGYPMSVFGFVWCWDLVGGNATATVDPVYGVHWFGWARTSGDGPGGSPWGLDGADYSITGVTQCMDTYLAATKEISDYCTANGLPTKIFYTTGPVDDYGSLEAKYQAYIKHEYIRNYIEAKPTAILFDYADILCYDNSGNGNTATWNGHTFPAAMTANIEPTTVGHISDAGALRLGKAIWWMLARIAGWDGRSTTTGLSEAYVTTPPEATIKIDSDGIMINTSNKYLNGQAWLYNLLGHLIDIENIYDNMSYFNTSFLSPGLYFVVL